MEVLFSSSTVSAVKLIVGLLSVFFHSIKNMQETLKKVRYKANTREWPWAKKKAEAIKGKARWWNLAVLTVVSWRKGATFSRLLMNVCSDVCEALSQAASCSSTHKYCAGCLFCPQPPPASPFCLENTAYNYTLPSPCITPLPSRRVRPWYNGIIVMYVSQEVQSEG